MTCRQRMRVDIRGVALFSKPNPNRQPPIPCGEWLDSAQIGFSSSLSRVCFIFPDNRSLFIYLILYMLSCVTLMRFPTHIYHIKYLFEARDELEQD